MPFIPIINGSGKRVYGARIRFYVAPAGDKRRRVSFHLSRDLVAELGWQGGERVVVSLGAGEDLGAFQISRVTKPKAGVKLTANPNCHGLRCSVTLSPGAHGVDIVELFAPHCEPFDIDFVLEHGSLRCVLPSVARSENVTPLAARGAR